jgi:hypothetical protein
MDQVNTNTPRNETIQQLTLTLYGTHLKIEDAKSGELIEDVPINQIQKVSKYFSSRLKYTLYGLIMPTTFLIKTDKKTYKISWVNRDKEALLLGGPDASEVSSQQNYANNMKWAKAIRELQK